MRKDNRRLFTESQKMHVLEAAKWRCQGPRCKNPDLTSQMYEFHHVVPHSLGGVTEIHNCQVLCIPCHIDATLHAGSRECVSEMWPSLRQWQRDAFDAFVRSDNERVFALEAAPGAGKSRFAALATRYVIDEHPEIDHVICVAPWRPIINALSEAFSQFRMDVHGRIHSDKRLGPYQKIPQGDVTVDTYAALCSRHTVRLLERWQAEHGFRFMLILDEIHHTNVIDGKWGPYADRIASMATKLLVMSGTYFRSDNKAISFLRYNDDGPAMDFSIDYPECVQKRYVRQVSFRFHDPELEIINTQSKKLRKHRLSTVPASDNKMTAAARVEVLDPKGPFVGEMISEAWSELQVMRRKWPDAACLIVCQPGANGDEDRAIHAIESRVREITGSTPTVVTHDNPQSHGQIEAFRHSSDPFLCAIRMVSEGVDIPRIRLVLFMSITNSEMLFRQIVGRALRYIDGKEDDTAALVIMPKFNVMAAFAERFESEAEQGAIKMEPRETGSNGPTGDFESTNHYVVTDAISATGGGQIAASSVQDRYIEAAKIIREQSSAHQHANVVQLGDALQMHDLLAGAKASITLSGTRELEYRNFTRRVEQLARHAHGGSMQDAWVKEVHERFNADAKEIEGTWRIDKIREATSELKERLMEVLCNDR